MFQLSISEILFYGGIAIMIITVIVAVLAIIIFTLTGQALKAKLEQEYGKPAYYNRQQVRERRK